MAFAMYQGTWKLVLTESGAPFALYDLSTDLGEEINLVEPSRTRQEIGSEIPRDPEIIPAVACSVFVRRPYT